ncbi:MAG TPA: histidinol-phosphatase [Bacteroidales bacterium]|jgi:histidinol-phosphatase (PHP family)|nr:histidinol-phosphatase [Bacteroidales bacterium]HOX73328.1 histidinol-phosphatase [Bacteroidales bacterium]HPM86574.1 histidinol-phosphatase [Bacteroidales bacterium]HQM67850.1 histidinol-phosphatase [Bacteroidales bacterium]
MKYITDYHIHTTFSDGKATPEDYIAPAIEKGISEIGFSEHLALFKEDQDWLMNPGNVIAYLDYIDKLKNRTEKIIIRKGLEVDYLEGKETETAKFLDGLALDYRIGSVHYLGEKTVDEGPDFYTGKSFDRLFVTYFNMVGMAVGSGLFDIIGHPDLIRIFGYKPSFDPEPYYRRLARQMKKNDVAFEVNTNGRNRPLADFYPDRRFLHLFSEEKVAVCVNSDAHMPSRVGQYFDEAYRLLKDSGFTSVVTFSNRERRSVPI